MSSPDATHADAVSGDSGPFSAVLGRSPELERLEQCVGSNRLVQIVGPPGVGASTVLRTLLERLPEAAVWGARAIEVRGRPEPRVVTREVAAAGEVDGTPSVRELARRIDRAEGSSVLALDLPHGVESRDFFDELVRESRSLTVVVATQIRQRVTAPTEVVPLEGLPTAPAVELFRRRAAVRTAETAGSFSRAEVEQLVDRVGRVPLAIEAAADLTSVMSVREITERWDQGEPILFDGGDGGPRERLRRALESSWQTLGAEQRRALGSLSLCRGAFPTELLERIMAGGDDGGWTAHGLLEALVRHSWLRRSGEAGTVRFELSSPYREFAALRRGTEGGANAEVRRSFAAFAREDLEALREQLHTEPVAPSAERLARRAPMYLEAARTVARQSPTVAGEIGVMLAPYAPLLPDPDELREFMERLLEEGADELPPDVRTRVEIRLVELHQRSGRSDRSNELASRAIERLSGLEEERDLRAEAYLASSLPLVRIDLDAAEQRLRTAADSVPEGCRRLRARIEIRLGYCALRQFELEEAREQFGRARTTLAPSVEPKLRSSLSAGLGYVAFRLGRAEESVAAFEEALVHEQRFGVDTRIADAHFNLGDVALQAGRLDRARREFEAAEDLWSEVDHTPRIAFLMTELGMLLGERERYDRAREVLRRALRLLERVDDTHNRAVASGTIGLLALAEGASPPPDVFRDSLRQLEVWRDPDIAAVFRTAADVRSVLADGPDAESGTDDRASVTLRGLRKLVGPDDHRLRRVVVAMARTRLELFERLAPEAVVSPWRDVAAPGASGPSVFDRAGGDETGELPMSTLGRLLHRTAREALESRAPRPDAGPPREEAESVLHVHPQGHWFELEGGPRVDLMNRAPMRRILGAIVRRSLSGEEAGAEVDELIEEGWPNQSPTRESGASRVYNCIRRLRDQGLEEIVVTGENGYRIDGSVAVFAREEPPES